MSYDIRGLPYPSGIGRPLLHVPVLMHRIGLGWLLDVANILILTTRGRKTGVPRYTPLEYRRHGKKLYAVAAWGQDSQWLQNLRADPQVTVCRGTHVTAASAAVVESPAEVAVVTHLFRRSSPLLIVDAVRGRLDTAAPPQRAREGDALIVRFDPLPDTPILPAPPDDLRWLPVAGAGAVLLLGAFAVIVGVRRALGDS